jgi:surfactin synthase thioesterase subunit
MNSTRWIVAAKPRPNAVARLFCFSHAGAGGAAYRGWADAAPAELEVCTVQLPGRENRLRETPFTSLPDLSSVLSDAIQSSGALPFAFFGHSLGAIVAFETARRLRDEGLAGPKVLFVSASRAPQLPWPHSPVRDMSDLDLLHEVNRRYESVPDVILGDAELRELLTPALRADMTLVETYQHETGAPFEFPIFAFGGDDDRMVMRPELEQWNVHTSSTFKLRMLPGDHLFLPTRRKELLADIAHAMGIASDRLATSIAG